jgi:catechol 2,3-dioxygenase-like lactoylglutathione lyase family enzyme
MAERGISVLWEKCPNLLHRYAFISGRDTFADDFLTTVHQSQTFMAEKMITGIQQLGIGIPEVHTAWAWYRKHFGMDVPIFEEAATAALMLPYTGQEPRARHAVLAVNLQGGSGMEIWQYTSRTPVGPAFSPQLGDLGIYVGKIKCPDAVLAYWTLYDQGAKLLGPVDTNPAGTKHFFVEDPYGNLFEVVESDQWFAREGYPTGGVCGAMIGVSDVEKARRLYTDILGYDQVVYDDTSRFADLANLPGGGSEVRRVLLTHSQPRQGGFSRVFGPSYVELVSVQDRTPRKLFEHRLWGDLGFIHLCFDIVNMAALRQECEEKGFPFTVDSEQALGKAFDMGEAAGRFSYIEDPDGTLIEFVETLKLPLVKKIGWYLDLRKRDPSRPLPDWMMKALRLSRVK